MVVKAKPKLAVKFPKDTRVYPTFAVGFDLSPSSLAGCAKVNDALLGKIKGPVWMIHRWEKGYPHFEKIKELSRAEDFVHDLLNRLGTPVHLLNNIYIGIEDLPARVMQAGRFREQAELVGAFLAGLLRYRYPNVELINIKTWHALVAADLEMKANKDFNKWHVKEWVEEVYGEQGWPDLIRNSKLGLIPQPEDSKAKPEQPDDRYDSAGIMEAVWERAHASK